MEDRPHGNAGPFGVTDCAVLPLAAWDARLEEATRIAGALIDGDDGDWLELRSKVVHAQLQRLPDVTADVEAKCAKIHRSRDPFQVPPNEEGFVRRKVLSKVVERGLQLWRPVGEQDHLCLFRESNEVGRTRRSPDLGIDSIAGRRQCRSAGGTNELQESPPVHRMPAARKSNASRAPGKTHRASMRP